MREGITDTKIIHELKKEFRIARADGGSLFKVEISFSKEGNRLWNPYLVRHLEIASNLVFDILTFNAKRC